MLNNFIFKACIKNHEKTQDPKVRQSYGVLSGTIGIIFNFLLFSGKLFVGYFTSSVAVSADAFNNLSDAVHSIVTLICFKLSRKNADKNYPFGYGRIEYIAGMIVSFAIIFTGIEFVKSSIEKIFSPPEAAGPVDMVSVLILLGSIALKLWLGFFNRTIHRKINSVSIKAASLDSFIDVIITLTILASITITHFTNVSVDAYTGLLVSIGIIFTGITIIKETFSPLLGKSPDPKLVKEITKIVFSNSNILGVHGLMVHNYGPKKMVISLHTEMPANLDAMVLHNSVDMIEKALKNKFDCEAIIHIDPIVTNDEVVNSIREKMSSLVKLIHKDAKIYDLRIVKDKTYGTVVFEVSVPFDLSKSDEEITSEMELGVKVLNKNYTSVVSVRRDYI